MSPTEQVQATATAIATARGLPLYGYFTAGVSEFAIATSAGPATSERLTDATFVALAGDSECSGWASRTAWQIDNVELDTCSREAVEKAQQTRGARASLPPGRYRAVLEPYALGDLLQRLGLACFGGAAFLEGRSLFSGRLGEQIFDSSVWIADDGLDEDGLPKSVDFEGVPKQRVPLVEGGVAGGLVWDRPTARRARRTSTGHARPPIERRDGPLASALVMSGGAAASVDELVAAVDDGVLITRVHYLGVVSEREAIITGMTRDGTFRIRRGRIAEPLVNHRFTVSMQDLFGDVIALSKERRLVNQSDFYSERYPIAALVPYLATSGMVFTGAGSRPGV